MKLSAFPLLCFAWLASAQGASCIDEARDRQAFEECAQKEILPLEAKVVSRVAALRTRYRNDREALQALEQAEAGWNAYRNGHCRLEAQARGRGADIEVQRAFAACTKRELESRLKELEGL